MSKVSPTTVIQDYIKSRSLPVTRQEIVSGTMLSKDQVRKATNEMVLRGRLATEMDDMGVTRYMSPEENMRQIAEAGFTLDELGVSPETVYKVTSSIHKPTKTESAWGTIVEEAEERGFAKGYAVGVQEAQRAAYELGKESVISKLTGILR